jgi:hypothetical protein
MCPLRSEGCVRALWGVAQKTIEAPHYLAGRAAEVGVMPATLYDAEEFVRSNLNVPTRCGAHASGATDWLRKALVRRIAAPVWEAYRRSFRQGEGSVKKSIAGGVVAVAFALSTFAGLSGSVSASNDYCGASSNGCDHSGAKIGTCAGHGSFGAFGQDNNFAGGANGDGTAYNNSTLCGNPQGAAGELNP